MAVALEEAAAIDLDALLVGLEDNSLAWMANRMTGQQRGHAWRSRDEAEAAVLHAAESLDDGDPLKELPWRWANDASLDDWRRNQKGDRA